MKRELRALGEGADQDENQRRQIEGMAADQITGVQHPIHVVASDDVTEQHEADEQAYAAERGHDERHPRAVARALVVMPIADQQERKEARHLPEKGDLDEEMTRSEEHTSELQSLMRISYAVFCLKTKKTKHMNIIHNHTTQITIHTL